MKRLFTIVFSFVFIQMVNSQSLLNQAMEAYQNQKFEDAMKLIEAVILDEKLASDPYAWHLRGYIYKDYFKKIENEKSESPNREKAIESYLKSKELDKTNEFLENNLGNLKYLAVCYYNDAVRTMDTVNYERSLEFYEKYKNAYSVYDPGMNYKESDIKYYNALASVVFKQYDPKNQATDKFFEQTCMIYKKVLDLDTSDCFANEQMGILYYNKGVDLIMNIDIENTDILDITKKQEECNKYWEISLPFLLRAYRHCDGKANLYNIIEGIKGIYHGLDMKDNYDRWDQIQKRDLPDNNGDK